MNPVLIQKPIPISSFGLFLLLAFWVGIAMTRRRSAAAGVESNAMLDLGLYMIVAGIIGARLGYVLVNASVFLRDPLKIVTIWQDAGLAFYGAVAGGVLVAWSYARARKISVGRLLDAAAPGLAVGYAVAMIGALLHGLYRGRPSGVPWAVEIGFEKVHPTQLYLLVAAVGIYFVLRGQRGAAPGGRFLTFLLLQAVSRFTVEFFVQSPMVVGPLTLAQAAALAVALVALLALLVVGRRPEPEVAAEPSPSVPSA